MKIDDGAEILLFQFGKDLVNIFIDEPAFIDVRIVFNDRGKRSFGQKMNFSAGELFFHTANDRSCQYDIADGAESYDENLFQRALTVHVSKFR